MRKALNALYDGAGYLAALFMVGCLGMVLIGIGGRLFGFHLRGTDAYAGYCMAAAGFLALAHTLKRGEHIRVTLLVERMGSKGKRAMAIVAHAIALFFSAVFAFFSVRLVWVSHQMNDISQSNDASPLWIPQIGMAIGAAILFIAIFDEFILVITGKKIAEQSTELKLME
jgi:TRAP-type C4-dicarboxylate transport system permease small subunit